MNLDVNKRLICILEKRIFNIFNENSFQQRTQSKQINGIVLLNKHVLLINLVLKFKISIQSVALTLWKDLLCSGIDSSVSFLPNEGDVMFFFLEFITFTPCGFVDVSQ